jgi:hypothetical protein
MFVMNDKNLQQPISFWVELLRGHILIPDADKATVSALCCHLGDLGVLEKSGQEQWRLAQGWEDSLTVEKVMEKRLHDICVSERGFALRYFLKDPPPVADEILDEEVSKAEHVPKNNSQLLGQKTSNLSNLQLVKKYGRQVQSFIELEKSYTKKLLGPQTTPKEARKIFNFILSRLQQKTEPRSWEQLSRRRHK